MMPVMLLLALCCVGHVVDMVDWGKVDIHPGVARVRWKPNTCTILAPQSLDKEHFFFVCFVLVLYGKFRFSVQFYSGLVA